MARVPKEERTFQSEAVDRHLEEYKGKFKDEELYNLFVSCYPNTLDTTIYAHSSEKEGEEDTFVITGDITAMWLRDSTNQITPYLRFAKEDEKLLKLIRGVLNRQVNSVLIDPYANAFNYDRLGHPDSHRDDSTSRSWTMGSRINAMTNFIFERKYELDSLAAVLKLSSHYFNATEDTTPFNEKWEKAVETIMDVIRDQQKEDGYEYRFNRLTNRPTETLLDSIGYPSKKTGMARSAFRPSDDATHLPLLVPANAMMVVELRNVASILRDVRKNEPLAKQAEQLADEIDEGIRKYAVFDHKMSGTILAYEVDGYGNHFFMDDANIPSLLSLPYLGYCKKTDPIYTKTREAILSDSNPYYFEGKCGKGTGGPHCGMGRIWPMSIIMRAYTTDDEEEIMECLETLKKSATTGYMHESYWKDNFNDFSRSWFAWANSLFGDLIFHLIDTHPKLILKESGLRRY